MIQFTIYYHPTHYSLSSSNLTLYRHQFQLPTASLNIPRSTKIHAKCFWHPPHTAVAHEGFATSNWYSTCRAQCHSMYSCVRVCLQCRGAHVRCLSWHPDGESELYGLCSAQTERQTVSVFSETFCQVLNAVELHPEHTVWLNELPVWKDLPFGGRTK